MLDEDDDEQTTARDLSDQAQRDQQTRDKKNWRGEARQKSMLDKEECARTSHGDEEEEEAECSEGERMSHTCFQTMANWSHKKEEVEY